MRREPHLPSSAPPGDWQLWYFSFSLFPVQCAMWIVQWGDFSLSLFPVQCAIWIVQWWDFSFSLFPVQCAMGRFPLWKSQHSRPHCNYYWSIVITTHPLIALAFGAIKVSEELFRGSVRPLGGSHWEIAVLAGRRHHHRRHREYC